VQSCRGTFGSGGTWQPFQTEVEDGVATVEWLRWQPWFGGTIGMFGPSYLGFAQWAVAAACPEEIRALAVQVGSSRPRAMIYPGGCFSLRTMLAWTYLVGSQAKGLSDIRIKLARPLKLRGACDRLPRAEADSGVLGEHFPFFQDLRERGRRRAALGGDRRQRQGRARDVWGPETRISSLSGDTPSGSHQSHSGRNRTRDCTAHVGPSLPR
jgi:predicted acyl esterase